MTVRVAPVCDMRWGPLHGSRDTTGMRISLILLLLGLIIVLVTQNTSLLHDPGSSEGVPPGHSAKHERVFSQIYEKKMWGYQGGGSGGGSSMEYTKRTRALVEMLVYKYNLDLWVDAPCGAMTWMPSVLERIHEGRPSFRYLGVDVVPDLIKNNTERIKQHYISFRQHDFSSGPIKNLPAHTKSAIFCRDALQHLSYDNIISALESFAQTSVDYLIIGSYYKHGTLQDVLTGGYFAFDISKIVDFPEPIDVISEETVDFKHMVVFKRNDLKGFPLRKKMMESLKL